MSALIFDKSAVSFVLEAFNKTLDEDNFIVESDASKPRVIAQDGSNVRVDRFAGIRKGSEVYIKSDILSLIELCDDLKSS